MKTLAFKELLNNLNDLTDVERRTLTLALQRVGGEEKALEMIEARFISQDCPAL